MVDSLSFELTGESSAEVLHRILNEIQQTENITRVKVEIEAAETIDSPVAEAVSEPSEHTGGGEEEEDEVWVDEDRRREIMEGEAEHPVEEMEQEQREETQEPTEAFGKQDEPEDSEETEVEAELTPEEAQEVEEKADKFPAREGGDEKVEVTEGGQRRIIAISDEISDLQPSDVPNLQRTSRAYTVLRTLVSQGGWLTTEEVRNLTPTPNSIPEQEFSTVLYQLYERGLAERESLEERERRYRYKTSVKGQAAYLKAAKDVEKLDVQLGEAA